MGDLLDKLRLHPRRLLCLLVRNHQLAVGGIQLAESLATEEGMNHEEDDNQQRADSDTYRTLMRQLSPLLSDLALLTLRVIDHR